MIRNAAAATTSVLRSKGANVTVPHVPTDLKIAGTRVTGRLRPGHAPTSEGWATPQERRSPGAEWRRGQLVDAHAAALFRSVATRTRASSTMVTTSSVALARTSATPRGRAASSSASVGAQLSCSHSVVARRPWSLYQWIAPASPGPVALRYLVDAGEVVAVMRPELIIGSIDNVQRLFDIDVDLSQHLDDLDLDETDDDDEPVLRWKSGRLVDTWRESYPYDERMPRPDYEVVKRQLQIELLKLQNWIKDTGQRLVILFEGRDAAGKGGTIKRFAEHLNPRGTFAVALERPNEREVGQWYFQRYVERLPSAGEIVLFDRSWYNRAGVERVFGFCTDA